MDSPEQSNVDYDSDRQYLGTVYAKSLLSAVDKAGNTAEVLEQFDGLVSELLDKLPKLDVLLTSPRVPLAEKTSLLDKALKGHLDNLLLNFLKVVCHHGRFDCIRAIQRRARQLYNEASGRLSAVVVTAEEIDDSLRNQIAGRLAEVLGRKIDLSMKIDPSIIGGLLVRVGDTVYDGSVANQLNRVRHVALDRASQQIRQSLERFAVEA